MKPSPLQQEIESHVANQRKLGGITPSKMKKDDVLLVDTGTFVYQLTAVGDGKLVVDGGGVVKLKERTVFRIDAHCTSLKYDMEDWIGHGCRLVLRFVDGTNLLTGDVSGAIIKGKDSQGKGYSYEFWDDKRKEVDISG